jgi:predicted transcriptional regulator
MTDVLMSIKPVFADRIFDHPRTKGYEYRRVCPKVEPGDTVVVYASAPVRRIVGQFPVVSVLAHTPEFMWLYTAETAGIDQASFFRYLSGCATAYAIRIGVPVRYPKSIDPRETDPSWRPPQSFTYKIPDLGDVWGASGAVRT